MEYKARILSYQHVRDIVDECLEKWHPSLSIPIPIEEILDCKMGVDIVPVSSLVASDDDDVPEAFVAKDATTIYVDESVYSCPSPNRLRFSLAHELAHLVLHRDLIDSATFTDLDGWRLFLRTIPDEAYKWVEYQAYWFAGLFLVPADQLEREFGAVVELLNKGGVSFENLDPSSVRRVAAEIGKRFEVSWHVIHKRAKKDELQGWPDQLP